MNEVFNSVMCLIVIVGIASSIYWILIMTIRHIGKQQQDIQDFNMAMAEATASTTNPLKYDDIVKIVEGVIANICVMDTIMNGYASFPKDKLSLVLDDIVEDIAIRSERSLSKEILRQWEKFVTPEYRTEWIIFKVRTSILYHINREASRLAAENRPRVPQPVSDTGPKKTVRWMDPPKEKEAPKK